MKVKQTKIRLNIMLLQQGLKITEPVTFITDYNIKNEIVFDKGDLSAILYKRLGAYKQADWVQDFDLKIGGTTLSAIMPKNQSHGVSLIIEIDDRIFAINWGLTSRHNIISKCIDKKFGIYTVNKMLINDAETQIKSAQSRVNETNPLNKQRQYGIAVSNEHLYISMEDNELIREIVAINTNSKEFRRIIGKYSFLNVQFLFKNNEIPCLQHLPRKLKNLLDIYKSVNKEDIKKMFKGLYPIDSKDLTVIFDELEIQLVSKKDSFFLFEPDMDFDFSSVSKFKYVISGETLEDDEFLLIQYLEKKTAPKKNDLESDLVHVLDENGNIIKTWTILECLYGEFEFNGTTYIMSHGEIFEISKDKYKRITSKIDSIIDESFSVPNAVKTNTKNEIKTRNTSGNQEKIDKERIFNHHLCNELSG
ncbi:TPA: DUF6119 family protein, partial [Legionella pneumophila]